LVFTTVHANNAFDVISRFVNMGIESYNFVASLSCILAQRLVRSVCPYCRVPVEIHPDQCLESGIDYETVKHQTFFEGKGLILAGKTSSEIRVAAMAQGMTSLRQAALEKVFRGESTLKEINRVTPVEDMS
jgi:type IV pilus assembly protein PilB